MSKIKTNPAKIKKIQKTKYLIYQITYQIHVYCQSHGDPATPLYIWYDCRFKSQKLDLLFSFL